jgi:hypothetical protein
MSARDAAFESAIARWLAVSAPSSRRLAALAGGPVRATLVPPGALDPHAARAVIRAGGATIEAIGASAAVRWLAQRLLGGPPELPAPRPLGSAEHAIWALVVAAALEDLGVGGEVWPALVEAPASALGAPPPEAAATVAASPRARPGPAASDSYAVELAVDLAGTPLTVRLHVPRSLELRVPPPRPPAPWTERVRFDLPIVLGRCALPRTAIAGLSVRSLVTIERLPTGIELALAGGALGLAAAHGAVVAEVVTGYVRRDMSLPDDAHVELSVTLGTTQLSLRQISELAIGQIVPLGRPLAGPFEVRAAGRRVGEGELVDVDGELAVRIVKLGDSQGPAAPGRSALPDGRAE